VSGAEDQVTSALDDRTIERLIEGLVPPEDAPPGYAGVARLVIAARRPASAEELVGMEAAVLAAMEMLRDPAPDRSGTVDRIVAWRRRMRMKVAGVVVAGTLVGTSGLAAAGVLPDPVQKVAAGVLGRIGLDVPRPADPEREVEIPTPGDGGARGGGAERSDRHDRRGPTHGRANGGRSSESRRDPVGRGADGTHGKPDDARGRSDDEPRGSDDAQGSNGVPRGSPPDGGGASEQGPTHGQDARSGSANGRGAGSPGGDGSTPNGKTPPTGGPNADG
jgi:hypothetical protein